MVTVVMFLTVATAAAASTSHTDPRGCDLQLVCAAARSRNTAHQPFMEGMRKVPEMRPGLTLDRSLPCSSLAPSCPYSDLELLSDLSDLLGLSPPPSSRPRRQALRHQRRPALRSQEPESWAPGAAALRSQGPEQRRAAAEQRRRRWRQPLRRQGQGMPPIFTPDGASARQVCRTCDRRKTVCTVYSVGTYAGCTGAWLFAGLPGQIMCNVATAPGSIGCAMNTLHCFMESCGLVTMPRLP